MAGTVLLLANDEGLRQKVAQACGRLGVELRYHVDLDAVEPPAGEEDSCTPEVAVCNFATFEDLKKRWPRSCVLLYAEPADSEQAIEAIKRGALDYIVTPIDEGRLLQQMTEALRVSRDVNVPAVYESSDDNDAVELIIGQSPAMKEIYKLVGLIAPRDINVLVTGESGTGKELIARAILHHSLRREQPFLAVNCAAIPETLLESELFGHEKGAFTGAVLRRIGKFEQCDGGTLFLDEVGDIPLPTQAKLLRVLQDSSFQRLGGTQTIHTDVRIIAATHQPLEELIGQGGFRRDLFYRLRVATIHVPPLREREVDVVLLAHKFVRRYNRDFGTTITTFAPETLPLLLRYPWPGNVRELENAIKSALVIARGTVFRPEFLPQHIREAGAEAPVPARESGKPAQDADLGRLVRDLLGNAALHGQIHEVAVRMVEREAIAAAVEHTNGKLAPAARLLGISRTTLRKKMSDLGIRTRTSLDVQE